MTETAKQIDKDKEFLNCCAGVLMAHKPEEKVIGFKLKNMNCTII